MGLAPGSLRRSTVKVGETEIGIRSLSRSEAIHIPGMGIEEAERFAIARSTDSTEDEAQAWLDTHDVDEGDELTRAIFTLSSLIKGKAGPKA